MIISASRRTDIPAFFGDWFMNRLRAGYCLVPNPFNPKQVAKISLTPESVDAFVFWSKSPGPLIKQLGGLDALGYRYYFQFTLNSYPRDLEPNVPGLEARIAAFARLGQMLGPQRVIWRYDPIIISNKTGFDYHKQVFAGLCQRLHPFTRRVVISIVDLYAKTKRNMKALEQTQGYSFDQAPDERPEMEGLLGFLAQTAGGFGLEITSCGEKQDYSYLGIRPGSCIDGQLISSLWNLENKWKKDPGQRDACACVKSRDIGMADTCMHGCVYCYSTISGKVAKRRFEEHTAQSTALIGNPAPSAGKKASSQMNLFKR